MREDAASKQRTHASACCKNLTFWLKKTKKKKTHGPELFKLEYTTQIVKHRSGRIILWGCFSARGSGALYKINCIMEKASDVDILKQDLKTSARMLKAWAQMDVPSEQ